MRKRWKKVFLTLLVLVSVAQIPFIYRRVQVGKLSQRIAELNATRTPSEHPGYRDLAGAIHVHTALGGHTNATFDELIQGAKGLDYVILTEHTADLIDTAAMTLNGTYGGVLFVGGNELDTASGDRMLLIPGTHEAFVRRMTMTPAFITPFQNEGRLAFVTYPERFTTWYSNFDGVEVFNLNTNARQSNPLALLFDALWSFRKYPELTLTKHLSRPDEYLRKFDEVARKRRITLFAGSDAHSNIGFHLVGDDSGNKHFNLKFDDYAAIFKIVKTHVLIHRGGELTQQSLLEALRLGHCFIAFDVLSDSKGFSFSAGDKIMGDETTLPEMPNLKVVVPQTARIVLLKNGEKIADVPAARDLAFQPKEKGAYRVEVFLDSLGAPFDRLPWIISNPIYVK
jgi:hypothetical protein